MLIGREKEQALLNDLLHSNQSEFVALYGRRRVGKTYLVRETFNYQFAFQHIGILDAPMSEQLGEFRESLYAAGLSKCPKPKTWGEAFRLLQRLLASLPEGKKVVFIDELPWMDTPKSNFIRALDHFWNAWATTRKDIILIVCGSATSWIIDNIVMNYGGLHDRVTRQIQLRPFTLKECEQYSQQNKLDFTRRQILEAYMVMGGIPYYWSFLRPGLSIAQNIDRMFFEEDGEMVHEYDALYASLFRRPKTHIAIVNALATKKGGLQREEILPSEKAHAYRMKYDAMKHRGCRDEDREKGKTVDLIGSAAGESGKTVQRYICLSNLSDLLLDMVDRKKLPLMSGVEISFLREPEQEWVFQRIAESGISVTPAQGAKLREHSKEGDLSEGMVKLILSDEKPKPRRFVMKADRISEYFPEEMTEEEIEKTIYQLLEQWKKQR